ncbi:AraC family transcriptional regulator [Roseobacter litoralis]|uniref:AraC family transcriptional regulator n=1 Tax=Roseobacter litoralis TaxID=42443 RepID=UPI002494AF01|nr:AraC family transcriptional regulator [Roseobacter litoralis]
MKQALRATERMLQGEDLLDYAENHHEGGHVIRPDSDDIACAHFTLGSHRSQIDAATVHALILSTAAKGRLQPEVAGQTHEADIRSGTLSFVPAGNAQNYDYTGTLTNTVLGIDNALFTRVVEIYPCLGTTGAFEPRFGWIRPAVQALVEEQHRVLHRDTTGSRVLAEAVALRLAYELLSVFNAQKPAGAPLPLSQAEITRLTGFIDAEMEQDFDLTDLARQLDRDPFGFWRSFKAATGESPHQYVIQRRIARVKHLLRTTADSLADISYATGFASQPHMTATFTKHVGTSPGKGRKAART